MQEFNFIIEYQEGKHNAVADGLSRRPDHKPPEEAASASPVDTSIRSVPVTHGH